ncbi:heparin lyase I family protein [Leisingera sp. ANG-Vp]|uniref:heparin lyase I family protein n=1 Tax=Leisingera sp. ANG-Vp TaxID=1577896 RepID=UPI00068B4936|nr:heparin lyase I family protein [Leisingera sp. ANG-Vp]
MYQTDYKRVDAETLIQLQDGRIDISDDGNVTLMRAGSAGSKVGKSTYSTAINTTDNSGVVTAEFDFMIPDGMPTSHIYLADIESKAASSGFNPGVRIQVRDGIIRVERGKIGIKELWPADMDELETGRWYSLKVELRPGRGDDGEVRVYLDGQKVVDENGQTVDTTSSNSWIDTVQVGLTANVNDYDAALAVRNIEVSTDLPGTANDSFYRVDPLDSLQFAEEIYRTGTEANPVYVNEVSPNQPPAEPDPVDPEPVEPEPVDPAPADPDPADSTEYNKVAGTDGEDVLTGTAGSDAMIAYQGADMLRSQGGSDSVRAGGGKDTVYGGGGRDELFGGDQGDSLYGGEDGDSLWGGNGYDGLKGGNGNDTLMGGAGNDKLYGGNGADSLNGGKGNDWLDGGSGNDTLKGAKGNDTFVFGSGSGNDVAIDFAAGADKVFLDFDAAELRNVRIQEQGGADAGVLISHGADSILLEGVAYAELSSNDFILA